MPLDIESIEISEDVEEIYVFDVDEPNDKHLAYRIDKASRQIEFFPREEFPVSQVLLEGFSQLPAQFSEKGYIKAGLMYYLNKKFSESGVNDFIISMSRNDSFRTTGSRKRMVLNYKSFKWLKEQITQIINEAKADKSSLIEEFFATKFPTKYKAKSESSARRAAKVMKYLDDTIVEHFGPEEQDRVFDFVEALLKTRYTMSSRKQKLFAAAKLKVDDIAVGEVLDEFEKMLKDNPHETKWGKFLEKNLYLLDSKYVEVVPELNVVLAGARKVDFGLVDTQGFLDIFEIKKPSTPLLSAKTDRGNYYWNTYAIKAITQAEKYLYNAERKAANLAEDIKREGRISVTVIKPRAFLLIGASTQLDTDEKKEDFRILRMSLKNIEIILYDELLERLKNQKGKIYIE